MNPFAMLLLFFLLLLAPAPTAQQQFSSLPSVFPAADVVALVRGNLVSSGVATTCQNLTLIRVPVVAYNAAGLGPITSVAPRRSLPGSWDVARPGHWPCTGTAPPGPSAYLDLQRSGCGRYLVLTCHGCPVDTTTACPTQVIARVDWSGAVDTSTSFPSGGVIFTSAYSVSGQGYYVTGFTGAGVRYVAHGGSSAVLLTALSDLSFAHRVLVYMGELYATAHFSNPSLKRGIVSIGSGLAPTVGTSYSVAVIPGRMAVQDPEQLLCMGFEFTAPTRITAACDTATDGNDYYNYFMPDSALVGSPARATFPSLHMVVRWSGGLIHFGTVRCFESIGWGGCGSRPSGTPGACLPAMSAPTASNCSGYYYLNGNMIDGFDAGNTELPTNAPPQTSSTFGIGYPNTAGANLGGVAQPPYNPPREAVTVLAVQSNAQPPGSTAPARVLLLSYLARPTAVTNWASGLPLGSPLYLTETLRAGVSSQGTTAFPHTQGLHDCVVPAWPNATTGATLTRSEDGRYLLLACYSALLTGTLSASARTIVRLAGDGSPPDATIGLLDYPGTPTAVASADGRELYIGGGGEWGGRGGSHCHMDGGARHCLCLAAQHLHPSQQPCCGGLQPAAGCWGRLGHCRGAQWRPQWPALAERPCAAAASWPAPCRHCARCSAAPEQQLGVGGRCRAGGGAGGSGLQWLSLARAAPPRPAQPGCAPRRCAHGSSSAALGPPQ